jgi:HSP20 family molecular chaperone IbpA
MATVTPYNLDRYIDNIFSAYSSTAGANHLHYGNSWHTTSTADNYLLEATMVGISKNDLKVTVVDNNLVIEATPSVKSRYATSFKRSWALAEDADVSRVDARLENGLLTLTIPKVKPTVRNINIAVQ